MCGDSLGISIFEKGKREKPSHAHQLMNTGGAMWTKCIEDKDMSKNNINQSKFHLSHAPNTTGPLP